MKVLFILLVFPVAWRGCTGYQITSCGSDGKVDVDEFRQTVLTCTGITNDTVTWNISRYDGTNLTVARCTWPTSYQNCKHNFAGFSIRRTEYSTSTLTVSLNGNRDGYRGVIKCGGPTNESDSDTCNLRIVYKADAVSNCNATVNTSDWTVTAVCEVDKMFAFDGHYACHWTVPTLSGNETRAGSLSTTNFTEKRRDYRRGRCTISGLPMPTADGVYIYTPSIDPGVGPLSGPRLEIKQPGNPSLASCPDSAREGDDVSCLCQASRSIPPAETTWNTSLPNPVRLLQLTNVNRSMDGINYICTQFWGGRSNDFLKRISYTLRVQVGIGNSGGTSQAIAGGVGGVVVIIVVIVVVVVIIVVVVIVVVVLKRRQGTRQNTSSSPPEAAHTYVNQAEVHNDRSDDNEDDYFGNYIDIINHVDSGEGGLNLPAVGGETTYELPTRRSQVVNSNIYTGLDPQRRNSNTQEDSSGN